MIVVRYWCPTDGEQVTAMLDGPAGPRCTICTAPLERMGGDAPEPGQGGPLDGGAPWPDVFEDLLCGLRIVQAPAGGRVLHWQAYVIDPARPQDGTYTAPTVACGIPGPYARPREIQGPACAACRDAIGASMTDTRAQLRQRAGRLS